MIKLGTTGMSKAYVGSAEVSKVYLGNELVYSNSTELTYVQDGLIVWFDGINKGNNNERWTDLVSGVYFTYNTHSTVESDGIVMDGEGTLQGGSGMGVSGTKGTIEACVVRANDAVGSCMVFSSANKANHSFITSGSGYCFKGTGTSSSPNQYQMTRVSKYTASFNADRGMLNGTVYTEKTYNDFNVSSTYARLGGRSVGSNYYYMAGKIHSLRIYTRKLSQEEMLHNQMVDDIRFNLGLNIGQQ